LPFGTAQQPLTQSAFVEQSGRQIWFVESAVQYEPGQHGASIPHGRVPAGRQLPAQ
jgi:hypothetical protein